MHAYMCVCCEYVCFVCVNVCVYACIDVHVCAYKTASIHDLSSDEFEADVTGSSLTVKCQCEYGNSFLGRFYPSELSPMKSVFRPLTSLSLF